MLEPALRRPEYLSPLAIQDYLTTPRWYAVHTYGRHEKKVATQLAEKEAVCFLPLRRVWSRWKDRTKLVEFPLFPGYVFVNVSLKDKLKVLNTDGVACLVGFDHSPMPIPDEQIHAIMVFVDEVLECDPHPYLQEGKRVEITYGPLRGLRGILVRKQKKSKFVISVDLIQKSVAIEIDASHVEPL
ncbi:MAG: UpxY family transcription antiterminator [Acidobacteria bacterium]|nr:UpxY family transcription antiterminator [Acidobacteriota bacterium]MBI3657370.1 UpxY family transcription antiterminator [Acidobacteriota bacterium]